MTALFRVYPPPPDLAEAIACFWIARGAAEHAREVVLPNGVVELILNLGGPQGVVRADGSVERHHGSFLAGLQRGPLLIHDDGDPWLIGVRFAPGGARLFVPLPLVEITDQVIDARVSGGREIEALAPRLAEARDDDARIRLLVAHLRTVRRDREANVPHKIAVALGRLAGAHADRALGGLADELGISHKHLDDLFRRAVGVSPRTLARIQRFDRASTALLSPQLPPGGLARLAQAFGYADQAHFTRETKTFSGVSPAALRQRALTPASHLRVDEPSEPPLGR